MQMALPHVNPDGKFCSITKTMALLHANSGKCTISLQVEIPHLEKNLRSKIRKNIGQEPQYFMEIPQWVCIRPDLRRCEWQNWDMLPQSEDLATYILFSFVVNNTGLLLRKCGFSCEFCSKHHAEGGNSKLLLLPCANCSQCTCLAYLGSPGCALAA